MHYLLYSEKSWKEGRIVSDTYEARGEGKGRVESKSQTSGGLSPWIACNANHKKTMINDTYNKENYIQNEVPCPNSLRVNTYFKLTIPECKSHDNPRE